MKFSAAIFDLDGTLLDTLEDLAYAGNQVLKHMGFSQHTVDSYRYFVGDGLRSLVERIVPDTLTDIEITDCCDMFVHYYSRCWDRKSRPYEGVNSLLENLHDRNIRCSILSNKPHQFTLEYVERFFNSNSFEYVFGQRNEVQKKPHPAGAFEIAKLMKVQPGECLYIGDTAVDMQTGKAAGMFTIGVLWGFREAEELKRNNADMLVEHPLEIMDYLDSLR